MLAKRVDELPAEGKWIFEPKWDGFRALVFRDGDELEIQSRDEKPLNRYFPEIVEALASQLPPRAVLDGEIVIARGSVLVRAKPDPISIPHSALRNPHFESSGIIRHGFHIFRRKLSECALQRLECGWERLECGRVRKSAVGSG